MAKLSLRPGSTSVSLYLFIRDSSVTTGAGLTGLAYNSGSLTAYYVRPLAAAASITLATQTATGAWSSGGFVAVDGANMPGHYRFDIPDACLATGVRSVVVMLKGAANMEPVNLEIDLDAQVDVWGWHQSDLLTGTGPLAGLGVTARGTLQAVTDASNVRLAAAEAFADDALIGQTFVAYSGSTGAGQARIISDNALTNDVVTFSAAMTTSLTGTQRYEIYGSPPSTDDAANSKIDNIYTAFELDGAVYRLTTNALELSPSASNPTRVATGTASSGSTSSLVCAALTQSDTDYWKNSLIVMTSGPAIGQSARITAFAPSTDTLTWAPTFTQAVANGHTFDIYPLAEAGDAYTQFNDKLGDNGNLKVDLRDINGDAIVGTGGTGDNLRPTGIAVST